MDKIYLHAFGSEFDGSDAVKVATFEDGTPYYEDHNGGFHINLYDDKDALILTYALGGFDIQEKTSMVFREVDYLFFKMNTENGDFGTKQDNGDTLFNPEETEDIYTFLITGLKGPNNYI
ncbi:MAG: hypothetical protein GOU98_00585 [Candidatus Altiarchaeota archaeon]|nr:hypothetical protein [Candidatus Altiarchaeota archaeon]